MATRPLISIKNVTSYQFPPNSLTSIPLKDGTLTLTEPVAGIISAEAKLFLTITPPQNVSETIPLTLPIRPDRFLGSKSGLCQTFRFNVTKELGTVEIIFPENVPEEDALTFEKIMVYNGFLMTGLVASADDFGKKIADTASNIASSVGRRTDERNKQAPTRKKDYEFSDRTKNIVNGTEQGVGNVAGIATVIGKAISGAAFGVGSWIGQRTGMKPSTNINSSLDEPKSFAKDTFDEVFEAGAITAKGIGSGILTVGSEIGRSASNIVQHDYGDDAKKLSDSVGRTGLSVVGVVKEVVEGTSVLHNIARVGIGAFMEDGKEARN
ncbi:hypothetical protein TWF694_005643 [Orbilia ellipsospora]|uniref:Senescence domain-containing protein n=1 Tax=Orbilia ellipsospora TaxID=2528407 RepID=A0AAV9WRI4_9PEZI